ncbi:FAD binding domain-containing protein [Roseovarius sp. B08]|uniref:FAD binding domain-containing protein n=1 Tax=Roseovarius sp. B08 TaxID=3449223 RepID=UPI003EDB9B1C
MTDLTINGTRHQIVAAHRTILDVLRDDLGLLGTKKGCGEGECGSCTIIVDGHAVCACLQLASSLEGKYVETVEAIRETDLGREITASLAVHNGVQCGFCTPGIVMSAVGHFRQIRPVEDIDASLEGNICRCTGYSKIRDALRDVERRSEPPRARRSTRTRRDVLVELQAEPDRVAIAGGTDLLVKFEGKLRQSKFLDLTDICDPVMTSISKGPQEISIGSLVTWSQIISDPVVSVDLPILQMVARGVGSVQVRNAGTLGGNMATASPAGDSLPALVALGACVEVDGPRGLRQVAVKDFLEGPSQTALGHGELIVRVIIPVPVESNWQIFRKVGPRRAQSIAKLSLALALTIQDGWLHEVGIAFGAVGPVPMTCPKTRSLLLARPLSKLRHDELAEYVRSEISPIDDFRSTSAYRSEVASRLLWQQIEYIRSGRGSIYI